jgi:FMN-dependent NADH-azoreductase
MSLGNILRVDASARREGSMSRTLADTLIGKLQAAFPDAAVTVRDVGSDAVPQIDERWIAANTTPAVDRTPEHRATLARSDALVAELQAADAIVIGCPIYNFSVPASLKAWIDQVCRAGLTFDYSPKGPKGRLNGKTAYVIVTSGGTGIDSPIDFATNYMRHVLGFIGVTDVVIVPSDRLMFDTEAANTSAMAVINQI